MEGMPAIIRKLPCPQHMAEEAGKGMGLGVGIGVAGLKHFS